MWNNVNGITAVTKKDLLTGELFTPKRKNQMFSSRLNQIKYNNKKFSLKNKKIKENPLFSEPNKKTNYIYPFSLNSKPLTQTEIGKYFTIGLICGIIITTVVFYYKRK